MNSKQKSGGETSARSGTSLSTLTPKETGVSVGFKSGPSGAGVSGSDTKNRNVRRG